MCKKINKHYKVFILLMIIILSMIILIYLSSISKKSSNNPPKEDITIDINKTDEIEIEEEVMKQVDTNDELEEVSNENQTYEIKNDNQVINNKSNNQKNSNTTSNSEQKSNTEVVSTPNNQEEHYEENNDNQVNDSNNENVNNNDHVENNPYIGVLDPNNFFYSIHHGKIEYADLQSCLDESYNILFKDTEDITNTTCIDVVDSQGTILGEYMQIKCNSGNCDKYKN